MHKPLNLLHRCKIKATCGTKAFIKGDFALSEATNAIFHDAPEFLPSGVQLVTHLSTYKAGNCDPSSGRGSLPEYTLLSLPFLLNAKTY